MSEKAKKFTVGVAKVDGKVVFVWNQPHIGLLNHKGVNALVFQQPDVSLLPDDDRMTLESSPNKSCNGAWVVSKSWIGLRT